jgi:D-arginine dehydrogenase
LIHDVAIIGAGIAGASVAAELDPSLSVVLLEAEDQPGYHATGRSAAFWDQCYGGPDVEPLTSASHAFLACPPQGFGRDTLLKQRGVLYLAKADHQAEVDAFIASFTGAVALHKVDRAYLESRIPRLSENWQIGVHAPETADIDVAGLHQGWLGQARRQGVELIRNARVSGIRREGDVWTLTTGEQQFRARTIVNAAGAWADDIARLAGVAPIGIAPYRRTVVQARVSPAAPDDLPLVIDLGGTFYFKPDTGGRLWISPHDEVACAAGDAAPEEMDVAVTLDRFIQATGWHVEVVERKWAGLRSFAPDRLPVIGHEPSVPGFFWCAGQGGFGIQTAPAIAGLSVSLIQNKPLPAWLSRVDPALYTPDRFRT